MKAKRIIFYILSIILLFNVSCKKDNVEKPNSFAYDGKTYETTHGYIESMTVEPNSLQYVYLCSSDITLQSGGGISGSGNYLMLSFSSNSLDYLIAGDYSFPVTFYAYFWLGYNPTSGTSSQFGISSTGVSKANVKVDNNTYEINYSISAPGDKTVKGNYKGTLEKITGFHSK